jgi:hypothetical protein
VIVAVLFAALPLVAEAVEEKAAVGFDPPYPSGASYDVFTATLPGLGLLSDGDGDGSDNDERCDSNGEARLALVFAELQIITAAGIACNALVSPGPQEVCFGLLTIPALALQAESIVVAQCKYQDGLVQAAEITAGYQNTRHMLATRIEEDLLGCNTLMSLRYPQADGGRAEEVRDLLKLRIDQYAMAGLAAISENKARENVSRGEADFAAGRFAAAYAHFCQAYAILAAAD